VAEHWFTAHMDRTWLLLIYTVPAEPSRKRAFIWREVKKAGAVYLRDGVCALPDQPTTASALRAIATKVEVFGGQATLVEGARLDPHRSDWIVNQSHSARAEEYADIAREAERLLAHVARETEHREFTFAEVEELEADLGKLQRWAAQVRGRDYFGAGPDERLQTLLDQCEHALGTFLDETASREVETAAR
jgi:hypothetical protein